MCDIIGLLNNSNSGSSDESGNESDLSNIVDAEAELADKSEQSFKVTEQSASSSQSNDTIFRQRAPFLLDRLRPP